MVFKEYLIELTQNNKRLLFKINLLIGFVEEVTYFQKNNANLVLFIDFHFKNATNFLITSIPVGILVSTVLWSTGILFFILYSK